MSTYNRYAMSLFNSRTLLAVGGLVDLLTAVPLLALPETTTLVLLGTEGAGPAVLLARAAGLALLALGGVAA